MKIAVITANLGHFDVNRDHAPQSVEADFHYFNDRNTKLRHNSMTPRLQAKIPKFFGWDLVQGYDYYIWIDSNLQFKSRDAIKVILELLGDKEMMFLKHPRRPTIWKEARYLEQGLDEQSIYLVGRYENENFKDLMYIINNDREYKDDLLLNGGIFIYKNTPKVHAMLKEWWYYTSRYCIQDQIPLPYVLKKSGVDFVVADIVYNDWEILEVNTHRHHGK